MEDFNGRFGESEGRAAGQHPLCGNCQYRIDGKCFNAINYLRSWVCTDYCIARLDAWVREHEKDLSDEQLQGASIDSSIFAKPRLA